MSTLGLVALVAVAVLLVILTVVVMLVVRQIAVLTVRLDRARDITAPVRDGLAVGAVVPVELAELLPPAGDDVSVFALVLGGGCEPCRELVAGLRDRNLPHPVVALIGSDGERAQAMLELLPPGLPAYAGEPARAAIDALRTQTTPSVYEITDGIVTGKAALRGADHLIAVMRDPASVHQLPIEKVGAP